MKPPRLMTTVFSVWSITATASAAFASLRAGRRDRDRVQLVHGLANLLLAVTTVAVFFRERAKDRT